MFVDFISSSDTPIKIVIHDHKMDLTIDQAKELCKLLTEITKVLQI